MNKVAPKSSAIAKSFSSSNSNLNKNQPSSKKFSVLPTPVKSESDKKEYKSVIIVKYSRLSLIK